MVGLKEAAYFDPIRTHFMQTSMEDYGLSGPAISSRKLHFCEVREALTYTFSLTLEQMPELFFLP